MPYLLLHTIGAFGKVFKGKLLKSSPTTGESTYEPVAVKSLKGKKTEATSTRGSWGSCTFDMIHIHIGHIMYSTCTSQHVCLHVNV